MSLPIVAIVGRPNVGKSSLLNSLTGRRISIVDPTPGVTRDRVSAPCAIDRGRDGRWVELVDTGGMGIEDADRLTENVETQIRYAVSSAAVILFVVDAREGVTPLDRHVASKLRRRKLPVILIANKIDEMSMASELAELIRLGFGEAMPVSAAHHQGIAAVLDEIGRHIGDSEAQAPERTMRLAIVGKRNAGKSTFVNSLAGEDRVIVSETPGTTRDSVDVTVSVDGETFVVIDTAGLRKRKSLSGDIEFYGYSRAVGSVRRADVVAMMIDASVKISQVDKGLSKLIASEYKPVVLVVNKWDLAQEAGATGEQYAEYLSKTLPELSYAPIALVTAREGSNVPQTIELARQLYQQATTRVTTGKLNSAVEAILEERGPSHKAGTRPPKIFYASQITTQPPTIVCFVNDVRSFDDNYQRFFVGRLREHTPFTEVPIRLLIRPRKQQEKRG